MAVPAAVPRPPGLGKKARKPIGADCRNGQRIVASPFFTICTIVFSVLFPLLSLGHCSPVPRPFLSGTISAVWTCSAEVGRRPRSRLLDRKKNTKITEELGKHTPKAHQRRTFDVRWRRGSCTCSRQVLAYWVGGSRPSPCFSFFSCSVPDLLH